MANERSEAEKERARERARQDARRIALQAHVWPRTLQAEPGTTFTQPPSAYASQAGVQLGERQAQAGGPTWQAYQAALARELARWDVAYFIVTSPADPPEFSPVAFAVDLTRWKPPKELSALAEPPAEGEVPVISDRWAGDWGVPPGRMMLERFKPRMPRWLRALDRFVLVRENERRRWELSQKMDAEQPSAD
jgi:hypothetical protein